jgi:catechol 2,3-dioxygenase-like lactoylglutathione lyase family enzyme
VTKDAFDGIDEVVITTSVFEELHALLTTIMGFRGLAGSDRDIGPIRSVRLGKSTGGGHVRLVEESDGRRAVHSSLHTAGPFALDFYVRDVWELYETARADGYRFLSEPKRYRLFGTAFDVEECVLVAPGGLHLAFVGYLPQHHRCVLGTSPADFVSEVIAVVQVVDDVDAALDFATSVLGGTVYLDERFGGPALTGMLGLDPGASFRLALVRGPTSRNARIEFIERVPGPVHSPALSQPNVVLSCGLGADYEAVVERAKEHPDVWVEDAPASTAEDGRCVLLRTPFALLQVWPRALQSADSRTQGQVEGSLHGK